MNFYFLSGSCSRCRKFLFVINVFYGIVFTESVRKLWLMGVRFMLIRRVKISRNERNYDKVWLWNITSQKHRQRMETWLMNFFAGGMQFSHCFHGQRFLASRTKQTSEARRRCESWNETLYCVGQQNCRTSA